MPPKKQRKPLITSSAHDELLVHTYTLEQLIEGAKKSSRAHVDQLMRRYGPALAERVARADPGVTKEGVVSEVSERLPDALLLYEHEDKFEAFLWTIAKNLIIDHQRNRNRHGRDVTARDMEIKRPRSSRRELEFQDLVDRLSVSLSARAREIWVRHLAGFSNQETATHLDMTPNAVGAALSRSRTLLKARAAELQLRRSDVLSSTNSSETF